MVWEQQCLCGPQRGGLLVVIAAYSVYLHSGSQDNALLKQGLPQSMFLEGKQQKIIVAQVLILKHLHFCFVISQNQTSTLTQKPCGTPCVSLYHLNSPSCLQNGS